MEVSLLMYFIRSDYISVSNDAPSIEFWQISPINTASGLLALIALLRALSNFEGNMAH